MAGPVRFCVIGRGVGKARVDSTCLASGKILIIAQPSPTDEDVRARRRKSVLDGGFQFEVPTEDAMRRDLPRIGARQLPHGGPTLIALFSLNLVINYEREIIINICLPRLSPAMDRPSTRTSSGQIWTRGSPFFWTGDHSRSSRLVRGSMGTCTFGPMHETDGGSLQHQAAHQAADADEATETATALG